MREGAGSASGARQGRVYKKHDDKYEVRMTGKANDARNSLLGQGCETGKGCGRQEGVTVTWATE